MRKAPASNENIAEVLECAGICLVLCKLDGRMAVSSALCGRLAMKLLRSLLRAQRLVRDLVFHALR